MTKKSLHLIALVAALALVAGAAEAGAALTRSNVAVENKDGGSFLGGDKDGGSFLGGDKDGGSFLGGDKDGGSFLNGDKDGG